VPEIQGQKTYGTEVQSHRGARALRPENTLPGLAHALALGVDALEFDVTLTCDGGLILAHDLVVEAPTILDTGPAAGDDAQFPYVGKRRSELTLRQVQTLDAGDRRPPEPFEDTFEPVLGTGVPTLDQVCRLVTEAGADRVVLAVELKTDPSWAVADVRALAAGAIGVLADHGLTIRARILGFDCGYSRRRRRRIPPCRASRWSSRGPGFQARPGWPGLTPPRTRPGRAAWADARRPHATSAPSGFRPGTA
jgi:glycerophosphoryl diester phosphodiesterase